MVEHKLSDRPGGHIAGGPVPEGFIVEIKNYQDGAGRVLQERVVISGEAPKDFYPFLGVGKVQINMDTPHGPQQAVESFRFPIEGARTVLEAFRQYDAFMERGRANYTENLKRQIAEASAPKVALAGADALRGLRPPTRARGG